MGSRSLFYHRPTRYGNYLDLIFAHKNANFISNVRVIEPLGRSDHSLIYFDLLPVTVAVPHAQHTPFFKFSNCNIRLASDMLSSINWHALFDNCTSIDQYWCKFKEVCLNVIKSTTPLSIRTKRRRPIPRSIRSAILKKRRLWRKYVLDRSPARFHAFRAQCRTVLTQLHGHRTNLEHNVAFERSASQFWSFCSSSLAQGNASFPTPMLSSGEPILDLHDLPDAFNSYFTSNFNAATPQSAALNLNNQAYTPLLSSLYLTPNDVLCALLKLAPKYNSPDGIPGFFLKTFAPLLVYPITTLFNVSLSLAALPLDWKHAVVTPLFKGKGSRNDVSNYRPISCTSVTGKMLESLVKQCLLNHFLSNNLITNAQFGFIPGRSTTSNLLYTDHLIHNEIAKGNAVDLFLFDISKAFDTVPHPSLLKKLSYVFGITGKLHKWLEAFLTNRTQAVKLSPGYVSSCSSVISGVIQGSVLGPILYCAYTNDIIRCFSHGKAILYADDLKVVFPIDNHNSNESHTLVMNDLSKLSVWSKDTGLTFNYKKCTVLHYGHNNPKFSYFLDNHMLPASESTTDLGVLRTTNLSYDQHCANIIRKANSTCAYILRTFATRNSTFLKRVFIAYVRPILEYACQLWSPCNIDMINRLEHVQRLFTKRIRSIAHLTYVDRLNFLCLSRLETRRLHLDLLFFYKLKMNNTHLSLHDFSIIESQLHVNRFKSVFTKSRIDHHYYTARTVRLWNHVLANIDTVRNVAHFRRLLHKVNFAPFLRGHI